MAEQRGVRTVTQLTGMLKEAGVDISVSQLGRMIGWRGKKNSRPARG
jgi:hypothetical protein